MHCFCCVIDIILVVNNDILLFNSFLRSGYGRFLLLDNSLQGEKKMADKMKKALNLLFGIILTVFMVASIGMCVSGKIVFSGEVNLKKLMYGSTQTEFSNWFKSSFFLHDRMVQAYNQIRYSCFNEASEGWIIGKEGYIFDKTQTTNYVKGVITGTDDEFNEYAHKVYMLQEELRKEGKTFIYIISPIKAQLCQEYLSDSYAAVLEDSQNIKSNDYEKLKAAFDANGVIYFDALNTLQSIKDQGIYPTYGPTRTHWTNYATAMAMSDVFKDMSQIYDMKFPQFYLEPFHTEPDGSDIELATLMNLKWYETNQNPYDTYVHYTQKSDGKLFLFGTSFSGQITSVLSRDSQAFDEIDYYVYLTREMTSNDTGFVDVNYTAGELINTGQIWNDLLDSDYIIMESQGIQGILDSHVKFLDYVLDKIQNGNQVKISELEGKNWGVDENNYRWGLANECSITIKQPIENCDTSVSVALNSYNETRTVHVYANDVELKTIEVYSDSINYYDFVISKDLVDKNRIIELKFLIDGEIYSPQECEHAGYFGDRRTLSIGISDLWIRNLSE